LIVCLPSGTPLRTALRISAALARIGEFSFLSRPLA
jgi:predicted Kef-type K+ transport protein